MLGCKLNPDYKRVQRAFGFVKLKIPKHESIEVFPIELKEKKYLKTIKGKFYFFSFMCRLYVRIKKKFFKSNERYNQKKNNYIVYLLLHPEKLQEENIVCEIKKIKCKIYN